MKRKIVQVSYSTDLKDNLVKSKGPDVLISNYVNQPFKKITPYPPTIEGWVDLSKEITKLSIDHPIWLAGECTIAPGALGWLQNKFDSLHVLWLDAHGDLNTPDVSTSGILSGMPLGWILGRFCPPKGSDILKPIDKNNITLCGIRDLDQNEREYIVRHNIFVTSEIVRVIERIKNIALPLYIHIDLDVIDPKENPGVSNPVEGGLSLLEIITLIKYLVKQSTIAGVSISSYNFKEDIDKRGFQAVHRILKELEV